MKPPPITTPDFHGDLAHMINSCLCDKFQDYGWENDRIRVNMPFEDSAYLQVILADGNQERSFSISVEETT